MTKSIRILDIVKAEISTDGRTVWVNDPSVCIGRFGRGGVDVHRTAEEQLSAKGQCLDCFHGGTPAEQWIRFRASMMNHHGVDVPDEFRPAYTLENV